MCCDSRTLHVVAGGAGGGGRGGHFSQQMNVQAEGALGFCSGGLEGDQDSLETLAPVGAPWRHWPRSAEGRWRVSQLQLVAGGDGWDSHWDMVNHHSKKAKLSPVFWFWFIFIFVQVFCTTASQGRGSGQCLASD